jgi:hypothetical protein
LIWCTDSTGVVQVSHRHSSTRRCAPPVAPLPSDPWQLLDPVAAASFECPPTAPGDAYAGLGSRLRILDEALERAGRRELGPAEEVALARVTLELSSRFMSLHANAVRAVFQRYVTDGYDEPVADRWACAELATACGTSEYQLGITLDTANALAEKIPQVGAAFAEGRLDWSKTKAFAHAVADVNPDHAARMAEMVLPHAGTLTTSKLRAALEEARVLITGETAEDRARQARDERKVVFRQLSDSMAEMVALLPAEDAAMLQNALHRLADAAATPEDTRTADQRRADTLVDTVIDTAQEALTPSADHVADAPAADQQQSAHPPEAGNDHQTPDEPTRTEADTTQPDTTHRDTIQPGTRPAGSHRGRPGRTRPLHALVTVPLTTLLGLSDDPATLAGHGPLPAGIVRELATRATWQCAVVDDIHGTLLGLGRSTFTPAYTPGKPLADHVIHRDQTCTFVGCPRQASSCELDHLIPYPRGSTCSCNLGPRCTHHHRLKHEAGWTVTPSDHPDHPPGSLVWTSPNGLRHEWLAPALTPAPRFARARTAATTAELKRLARDETHAKQTPPPF